MSIEIRVPALGESVTEATVGKWFKQEGEAVNADEPLVELETDKVTVEVPAPASGVLGDILVKSGTTVAVGSVLAALKDGAANAPTAAASSSAAPKTPPPQPNPEHVAAHKSDRAA
jgi:2-oxoglutarate dehydrogenase E2 component (dihydrolipoamide succinyltransferase)